MSLGLFGLLGIVALAVDVGNLWVTKRLMQSAADAGAVAAADEIASAANSDVITAAGKDAASRNGFTDGSTRVGGSTTVVVAVHNPPSSGTFLGNSNAVEVDVSESQTTYFMRVLGFQAVAVSASAVAMTSGSGSCVYSLDHHAAGAITVGGTAAVNSACGLYDNSDSATALTVSGGGTITAPLVGVVGGTNINGGGSTPPTTGIAQFGDPLAYIQAPTVGSCSSGSKVTPSMSPGTYCGGIKINAGAAVVFNSGLYVMKGGGLTINGGANVSGSGVTFYLTGDNKASGSPNDYAGVNINSTATVNLSAPCGSSGGGISGMLFFQDRSITTGVGSTINGSATSTFSGALYFPTTALGYSGSTSANMFTLLVADTMSFLGNSNVDNNFSCLTSGSLIKDAVLVQ
jgi:Flp pilus assembly protein TadG